MVLCDVAEVSVVVVVVVVVVHCFRRPSLRGGRYGVVVLL